MQISGPISAYHFSYQKTEFFLFGDRHGAPLPGCPTPCTQWLSGPTITGCYDIVAWLGERVRRGHVDIFLEQGLFSEPFGGGQIQRIYRAFESCFQRRACPYDNVGFHYLDIRQVHNQGANLAPLLGSYLRQTSQDLQSLMLNWSGWVERVQSLKQGLLFVRATGDLLLESMMTQPDILKVWSEWFDLSNPNIKRYIQPFLVKGGSHRIYRQLQKITPELRSAITKFILTQYRQTQRQRPLQSLDILDQALDYLHHRDVRFVTYWYEHLSKIQADIVTVGLLEGYIMDAYTLARLLRNFGSLTKIVYAGAIHINRYVEFFQTLGVKIAIQPWNSTGCSMLV